MKKILFVGDLRSIHLQKYIKWFLGRYEVTCFTDYKVDKFIFDKRKIKIYYVPQKFKFPIIRHLIQIYKLKKIIKTEKPDFINAHYITEDGWYAAFSGFHPVILTVYGSDIYVNPKDSKFYSFLHKLSLNMVDYIIVDSNDQKKEVLEYTKNSSKVKTIQYGVELEKFEKINKEKLKQVKKRLGIKNNDFVIFSPRHLYRVYNIDVIIKAFYDFQKKVKKSKLIVGGTGAKKNLLCKLAEDLGIKNKVIFTGFIKQDYIKYYYYISNIVVSIPSSDGMPLSVLEAMAVGKPVVVSDLPSLREIVKDRRNGFFSKINSKTLKEKFMYIYNNKNLCKKIGETNRKFVETQFNYKKQMRKIEKLFLSG